MEDVEILFAGRPRLDLTRVETIAPTIEAVRPDIVVSAAAYTAVDQAEHEPELAFAINATGAGEVARAAASVGVPIIQLSTDYVFDGALDRPYREDDAPGPQSVYGASKLAGEEAVAAANPRHLVLRTAWVYSPFGKNFVRTMLRLAAKHDEVSIVSDQCGNPTSALDIADGILAIARQLRERTDFDQWGIYHLAGSGATNWADFAVEIFGLSRSLGGPAARVRPIATNDYPTIARRPANSRLETKKLSRVFGHFIPDWRGSCRCVIGRLLEQEKR
jgi:dTDP-4-dehydrorhamnose reductase